MSEPLEAETLARMKVEHAPRTRSDGSVVCKSDWRHHSSGDRIRYPCSTALLLAELERVTAPAELAKAWWNGFPALQFTSATTGLAYGLLGPSTSEELS